MALSHRMYARALHEAAEGYGRVADVRRDLGAFAAALSETPELQAFLSNPQVETAAKQSVLLELTEGADELVRNGLRLLAEKGRAGEIAHVHEEFEALADRAEGRVAVELTTAYELSEEEAASIVRRIEEASGRQVEATRRVDPALVGGIVLQVGSMRLDASVRGRLERLRRELVTH